MPNAAIAQKKSAIIGAQSGTFPSPPQFCSDLTGGLRLLSSTALVRGDIATNAEAVDRPGVMLCTMLTDSGREVTAVRAVCICGALAFPTTIVPLLVQPEQLMAAAKMLLSDTMARCKDGVDMAPACIAAKGGVKFSDASRVAHLRGLSLVSP
jgi:hypothetical protein